jgi:hypothetical protein
VTCNNRLARLRDAGPPAVDVLDLDMVFDVSLLVLIHGARGVALRG